MQGRAQADEIPAVAETLLERAVKRELERLGRAEARDHGKQAETQAAPAPPAWQARAWVLAPKA